MSLSPRAVFLPWAKMSRSSSSPSSNSSLLPVIGSTIMVNAGLSLVQTLLYGFFCAIIIYSTHAQLRRRPLRRAKKVLLSITIFLFLSCTMLFVTDTVIAMRFVSNSLVKDPEIPLAVKLNSFDALTGKLMVFQGFLKATNYFSSDAVVVWRAWALWPGRRRLMSLPCVLLSGSFVSSFLFASVMAAYTSQRELQGMINIVEELAWSFSLATNIVGTSLIGYKAWIHRKFLNSYVGQRSGSSLMEKTLLIILESGLVYCLLFIAYIAMQTLSTRRSAGEAFTIASGVLDAMCSQLSGLYPTIVVVLVSIQNSAVETLGLGLTEGDYLKPLHGDSRTSRSMKFANRASHSMGSTTIDCNGVWDNSGGSKAKAEESRRRCSIDLREEFAMRGLRA